MNIFNFHTLPAVPPLSKENPIIPFSQVHSEEMLLNGKMYKTMCGNGKGLYENSSDEFSTFLVNV